MGKRWRSIWEFTKALAPYLAIGAICFGASMRVAFLNFPHSAEAAAWFQGLGTVAAVFITMSLAFRAENNAKRERIEQRKRFISNVANLAVAAHQVVQRITESIDTRDLRALEVALSSAEDMKNQFARLGTLSIEHWPTPFLAVAFDALGRELSRVSAQGQFTGQFVPREEPIPDKVLWSMKQVALDFQTRLELLGDNAKLADRS